MEGGRDVVEGEVWWRYKQDKEVIVKAGNPESPAAETRRFEGLSRVKQRGERRSLVLCGGICGAFELGLTLGTPV